MQPVFFSAGKALCRYCGESFAINALSTHVAKRHPRPVQKKLVPTLVKKAERAASRTTR